MRIKTRSAVSNYPEFQQQIDLSPEIGLAGATHFTRTGMVFLMAPTFKVDLQREGSH